MVRMCLKRSLLIYTKLREIRNYEITFTQHSHDYDFCNAEKLVDDFLLNVKNRVGIYNNEMWPFFRKYATVSL